MASFRNKSLKNSTVLLGANPPSPKEAIVVSGVVAIIEEEVVENRLNTLLVRGIIIIA